MDPDAGHGPPLDAMRRVIAGMVSVSVRILFLFGDPSVLLRMADEPMPESDPVIELIHRGQAKGIFDAELPAAWIQHSLWALVYRACQDAQRGELSRHGTAATVIRTLENGIRVH